MSFNQKLFDTLHPAEKPKKPRKVARTYLVIGVYEEDFQMYADDFRAFTAQEAIDMCLAGLIIAGVVTGRNMKVET